MKCAHFTCHACPDPIAAYESEIKHLRAALKDLEVQLNATRFAIAVNAYLKHVSECIDASPENPCLWDDHSAVPLHSDTCAIGSALVLEIYNSPTGGNAP